MLERAGAGVGPGGMGGGGGGWVRGGGAGGGGGGVGGYAMIENHRNRQLNDKISRIVHPLMLTSSLKNVSLAINLLSN